MEILLMVMSQGGHHIPPLERPIGSGCIVVFVKTLWITSVQCGENAEF
jgi:hypothetical protein